MVIRRGKPLAGFTVKHELVSWVSAHPDIKQKVWRSVDNPRMAEYQPVTDITDEINDLAAIRDHL
jgi:hypothetical protein